MNVTLSVDDEVLARARRHADRTGTSLNQLVRDYLHELTARDAPHAALTELEALWNEDPGSSGGRRWTRDSLYDRAILH
jgi:hypothetical protein